MKDFCCSRKSRTEFPEEKVVIAERPNNFIVAAQEIHDHLWPSSLNQDEVRTGPRQIKTPQTVQLNTFNVEG